MKTTRKVLSIALVLTMVVAMFVVSASAEEGVKLTNIDDITSSVQGLSSAATNVVYLSDAEPVSATSDETISPAYRNDTPWYAEGKEANTIYSAVYLQPDQGSRKAITKDRTEDANMTPGSRNLSVEKKTDVTMCYNTEIRLGGYGWKYDKGLGVTAAPNGMADTVLVYALNGANHFYAVVGNNDNWSSDPKNEPNVIISYELWASTAADGTYTKLAYAEISDWYVAEFNVDVSDYSHIKLVTKEMTTSGKTDGLAGAWGNACVCTLDAPVVEPTTEPTEEPTTAPTEEPTEEPTVKPTVKPTEKPTPSDNGSDDGAPVGLIIGIVVAVLVIAGVVVVIIKKKSAK